MGTRELEKTNKLSLLTYFTYLLTRTVVLTLHPLHTSTRSVLVLSYASSRPVVQYRVNHDHEMRSSMVLQTCFYREFYKAAGGEIVKV